jgi:DNA-binding GntR family transcriptional regulator
MVHSVASLRCGGEKSTGQVRSSQTTDLPVLLYTEYSNALETILPLTRLAIEPDLTERVYETLLASIADGELAPGARLTQEELAEKLHVSRQPVLQALRLLKKDGFVVDAGKRGVMVTPIHPEQIARLYQLRGALDALAARLAARHRAIIPDSLIVRGRKAAQGHAIGAMIDADIAFHNAVYQASGNPLIAESANRHWAHIRRAMGAVLQSAQLRQTVWDEHAAILGAIGRGDLEAAERLTREHGEMAGQLTVDRLIARSSAA